MQLNIVLNENVRHFSMKDVQLSGTIQRVYKIGAQIHCCWNEDESYGLKSNEVGNNTIWIIKSNLI